MNAEKPPEPCHSLNELQKEGGDTTLESYIVCKRESHRFGAPGGGGQHSQNHLGFLPLYSRIPARFTKITSDPNSAQVCVFLCVCVCVRVIYYTIQLSFFLLLFTILRLQPFHSPHHLFHDANIDRYLLRREDGLLRDVHVAPCLVIGLLMEVSISRREKAGEAGETN
jgi:hypothetical protein